MPAKELADVAPLFRGDRVDRGEVIVGLVGAIGTDMELITDQLARAFVAVAYRVETIRVSELINEFITSEEVTVPHMVDGTKLDELMDLGDALREGLNHGSAAAVLALGKIGRNRRTADDAVVVKDFVLERSGVATVIRQLKHPEEVEVLRSIYGPRFVLIGVWSPESERESAIHRRLENLHPGMPEDWYARHVRRLLIRDEKDVDKKLGQRVRDTYELADAFIAVTPGRDSATQISRLVRLLFGSPYETPTRDEHAMFVASGASLRSSDAGRQVGAVVVDEDGEILVTGVNEIPKPHGGQYWGGDDPDLRDFQMGFDENTRQKTQIITEIVRALQDSKWLRPDLDGKAAEQLAEEAMATSGPLAKSRVADLLEFARVAHAEMAAISTAARRGVSLGGQVMYTTTYPCHECARLIIASGIKRVIYVDPYPKSQVKAMYAREVSETANAGKVAFEPYRGVAPRLYRSVFRMTGRSKNSVTGVYAVWRPEEALPRLAAEAQWLNNLDTTESQYYDAAFEQLLAAGWDQLVEQAITDDQSGRQDN